MRRKPLISRLQYLGKTILPISGIWPICRRIGYCSRLWPVMYNPARYRPGTDTRAMGLNHERRTQRKYRAVPRGEHATTPSGSHGDAPGHMKLQAQEDRPDETGSSVRVQQLLYCDTNPPRPGRRQMRRSEPKTTFFSERSFRKCRVEATMYLRNIT